ncbi:tRNA (N6-threonylcarbamoyladenosine(37)-N6)-methyltransferase TrmO [Chloroflexota bacterium]
MTNELPTMTLKAIGVVHNKVKQMPPGRHDWFVEIISEIIIDSSLTEALDGLEAFSHIIVLYWIHRLVSGELPIKHHPQSREELPLTGLFATRNPNRPNRIGKTTVRLLQRQGNTLRVKGLDALDGTPVIDIKPYIPGYDSVDDAEFPQWTTKLYPWI